MIQAFSSSSIGTGTRADLGTDDDLFVGANATLVSTDGDVTVAGQGSHSLDIRGMVVGQATTIRVGEIDSFGQRLGIGPQAYIANLGSGHTAVVVFGNSSLITNRGTINGTHAGLCVGGDNATTGTLVRNFGLIEASYTGVFRPLGSIETVKLVNDGEIRTSVSTGYAYYAGGIGKGQVVNNGLMIGDVSFGTSSDLYDGRGGGRVVGDVSGGAGADQLYGGAFADSFFGEAGDDVLNGGGGHDRLDGGVDSDTLIGGAGNDILLGGAGSDSMNGGLGNDVYQANSAGDIVSEVGGDGIDLVYSSISFDLSDAVHAKGAIERLALTGSIAASGSGNALANVISGNAGGNTLSGRAGDDSLLAGAGDDKLVGELGNDVLRGDAGKDTLSGGLGRDVLIGGGENDYFVFDTQPNSLTNRDVVSDFVHGVDQFWIENAVFKSVGAAGALSSAAFHTGVAAQDASDRIIYNRASGVLSYDSDGNGALPAVQFGVLTNKPLLTATDFLVI